MTWEWRGVSSTLADVKKWEADIKRQQAEEAEMSLEFFKPEDFAGFGGVDEHDRERAAHLANLKLKERGVRVYSCSSTLGKLGPLWGEKSDPQDIKTALLVCIEPFKHDTAESLLREMVDSVGQMRGVNDWWDRARALLAKS